MMCNIPKNELSFVVRVAPDYANTNQVFGNNTATI